jgi:hypothetical protein
LPQGDERLIYLQEILMAVVLLAAAGGDGALRVRTDVAEVKVFLDDQEVGVTPLTVNALTANSHRLMLIRPGYEDHTQQVLIREGETLRLFIVMNPADVKLPQFPVEFHAFHQHRFGGCVGKLIVTAEMLEFRADDGQDTFRLSIRELRSVARSMGTLPNAAWRTPAAMTACRVEFPGRGYGFWAREADDKSPVEAYPVDEITAKKTKELFEIVYQLWMSSMKASKKPG